MKKERIDIILVEQGFFDSREKAKKVIMTGNILVNDEVIDKPGTKINIDSVIRVRGNPMPYVSRGGYKLEKAISEFNILLGEKVGIDIGASTGGFTDCMLQNGAKKVFSIDVGYGQLDWKLRSDPRVVVKDRTNIRNVKLSDVGEEVDFISIDVSFISLELVLPVAKELIKEDGLILALIKPQFEVGKEKVGKRGVVREKEYHIFAIKKIMDVLENLDMISYNLSYSPIKGPEGNIEYLILLGKDDRSQYKRDINLVEIVEESHRKLN